LQNIKDFHEKTATSSAKLNNKILIVFLQKNFPLASVILLTYQQEDFVAEALNSLLAQTYTPLEIIIADDLSKDNTRNIIQKILTQYCGPHKIKLVFNQKNLGLCGNINQALSHCEGEFIFAAAGDDVSLPNRCKAVIEKWLALEKKPDLIATDAYDMAINGEILGIKRTSALESYVDLDAWMKKQPYFFGSSHSWSRRLINQFPPLNPKLAAEDHVMVFRSILGNGAHTIPEALVKHRRGGVTLRKYLNLYEKKRKLEVGFRNKLTYLLQLLNDAKNHPGYRDLEIYLSKDISSTQFSIKLFDSDNFLLKIKYCIEEKNTPLNLKLRVLTYTSFPWILQPIFWAKKYIKRY